MLKLKELLSKFNEAKTKNLTFINVAEKKKALALLVPKLGEVVASHPYKEKDIVFMNDGARRDTFKILGKDYIKKNTTWKGNSIWEGTNLALTCSYAMYVSGFSNGQQKGVICNHSTGGNQIDSSTIVKPYELCPYLDDWQKGAKYCRTYAYPENDTLSAGGPF